MISSRSPCAWLVVTSSQKTCGSEIAPSSTLCSDTWMFGLGGRRAGLMRLRCRMPMMHSG